MAGIYIHVPFCKKKCSYCDFYKTTMLVLVPDFLSALNKEFELRGEYLQEEIVETIYLGGGTPSVLSTDQIRDIAEKIRQIHPVSRDCEITVEANPDDLNEAYLKHLR
jgi:oxygen-independent coproporphyrinogen-3 oxidase